MYKIPKIVNGITKSSIYYTKLSGIIILWQDSILIMSDIYQILGDIQVFKEICKY